MKKNELNRLARLGQSLEKAMQDKAQLNKTTLNQELMKLNAFLWPRYTDLIGVPPESIELPKLTLRVYMTIFLQPDKYTKNALIKKTQVSSLNALKHHITKINDTIGEYGFKLVFKANDKNQYCGKIVELTMPV